jgi:hypothetical protein
MPVPIIIAPMINQWASVGIAFLRLIGRAAKEERKGRRPAGNEATAGVGGHSPVSLE